MGGLPSIKRQLILFFCIFERAVIWKRVVLRRFGKCPVIDESRVTNNLLSWYLHERCIFTRQVAARFSILRQYWWCLASFMLSYLVEMCSRLLCEHLAWLDQQRCDYLSPTELALGDLPVTTWPSISQVELIRQCRCYRFWPHECIMMTTWI